MKHDTKITVEIPPAIHSKLLKYAASRHWTLRWVIVTALAALFSRKK